MRTTAARYATALFVSTLAACVPLSRGDRLAISSLACARLAVQEFLPQRIPDKQAHCLATASIAAHCSVAEAYGAGVGKELKDLLGRGDAEWGDLRADAAGAQCARVGPRDAQIKRCCAAWTEAKQPAGALGTR